MKEKAMPKNENNKELIEIASEQLTDPKNLGELTTKLCQWGPVNRVLFDYLSNDVIPLMVESDPKIWSVRHVSRFGFFGVDSAREIISTLVVYAGPLNMIEEIIRNYPTLLEKTFRKDGKEGTLVQLAIIGLDITIEWKNEDGEIVVLPGMANMLLDLHRKLVSEQKLSEESYELAIKQAQQAACVDKLNASDAKAQTDKRGNLYLVQLNLAFNEIKQQKDPKGVDRALENFKHFVLHEQEKVLGGRPALMKDCEYNLGLQQLHALAFQLFNDRGGELNGKWYGEPAKTYCFRLISGVIQEEMPSLMRSLLRSKKGIYAVLNGEEKLERTLDIDGTKFHTLDYGTRYQLGATFFYDCFGGCGPARWLGWDPRGFGRFFSELFTNTYNSIAKLLQSQPEQPKSQEQLLNL